MAENQNSPAVKIRAALYARVSTVNLGQSPEMQVRDFAEYRERRGWIAAGEYIDVGISGAKDRRPELDRLMADARRRKFDVIVVWKFDRFARSTSHLLRALEEFKALGIDFVSLTEGVDTSTPAGKMIFTILGAVAELERSLIAERVRAGLRNAKAKGRHIGRPRVAVDRAKIVGFREQGASWATICQKTGYSKGTAQRAVSSLPKTHCDASLARD
jgi:DNA invertase Pin-like site-specific DNA recombinase